MLTQPKQNQGRVTQLFPQGDLEEDWVEGFVIKARLKGAKSAVWFPRGRERESDGEEAGDDGETKTNQSVLRGGT